jgi:hypothetical protein
LNIHNFLIASRTASREWNKLWVIGLLFVLILINLHLELSSSFERFYHSACGCGGEKRTKGSKWIFLQLI